MKSSHISLSVTPLRYLIILFILIGAVDSKAQVVERIFHPAIRSVLFHEAGNPRGFPVMPLGASSKLTLEFDDLDANVKNYYYTFVLCDYQWKPAPLSAFDYIKGFTQNRITNYRYSSIAFTRYTHYQVSLPEQSSMPSRSGNYLLKVYLDGDTAKTVFTRQFVVFESKCSVAASVVQPSSAGLFYTHQRVRMNVLLNNLNALSPAQQVKVVVLQNNRWDIAQRDIVPTFTRMNQLEYNSENIGIFSAGREWRWLDLRSFSLQTDRVDSGTYTRLRAELFLKADQDREGQRYAYYPDLNGGLVISSFESIQPSWQGDYCTVHFKYKTPDGRPYAGKELYLTGHLTGYQQSDQWKMTFRPDMGLYELKTQLKCGYYDYAYFTKDVASQKVDYKEGNYWEAENTYTVLVYYKSQTDRNDQLIGVSTINTRADRPGFSF
jgi:hypothetical protein